MQKIPRAPEESSSAVLINSATPDSLLWEVLPHLQLNIAQTAALCGISVRQLGYWTKQNYVSATGHGARRMYGLDSLRRILSIKRAMTDGASLRQALRGLPDSPAVPYLSSAPVVTVGPEESERRSTAPGPLPRTPLSAERANTLAAELLALFAANRHTRDSVAGLAVKVGRAPGDVHRVAEALCVHGVLARTDAGGEAVFSRAGEDGL